MDKKRDKSIISKYSKGLFDFHTHSSESDGSYSPTELVRRAKLAGVSAMALTDHNVISGLNEFNRACKKEGILGIPFGTEIHAELPENIVEKGENDAPDLTMLGRNVDKSYFREYRKWRIDDFAGRFIPQTMEKLENIGFNIPEFDLKKQAQMGVPTIFHSFINHSDNLNKLFEFVHNIDNKILLSDVEDTPVKFLNRYVYSIEGPAYLKRCSVFSVDDAVNLAEKMGAKLFIAHPGGGFDVAGDRVLNYYIKKGIHGIEVRNYFHTPEQNAQYDLLAKKYGLLRSGGSDYHGENGIQKLGMSDVPKNQISTEILRELWEGLLP